MRRLLESWFHARMKRRAERLAERIGPFLPTRGMCLDIGSGTGHLARALEARHGGMCLEADIVDFHVVGPGPLRFDGERLPFGDGAVEACLLVHVLTYATHPVALLREAARVASRRVIVIQSTFLTQAGRAYLGLRGRIQGSMAFVACRGLGLIPQARDPMHRRRLYRPEQLDAMAAEAGLRVGWREAEPGLIRSTSRDLLVLEYAAGRWLGGSSKDPSGPNEG